MIKRLKLLVVLLLLSAIGVLAYLTINKTDTYFIANTKSEKPVIISTKITTQLAQQNSSQYFRPVLELSNHDSDIAKDNKLMLLPKLHIIASEKDLSGVNIQDNHLLTIGSSSYNAILHTDVSNLPSDAVFLSTQELHSINSCVQSSLDCVVTLNRDLYTQITK